MSNDRLLTVVSLLGVVLFTLHQSDDVVRGFEPGGFKNLQGMVIVTAWLCGALLLPQRRIGHVIVLLASLLTVLMPVSHMMGRGLGVEGAHSSQGLFFIWTLYALGVNGMFGAIVALRGLWGARSAT